MTGSWRESRVGLVAAALALLAGVPALIAAAGVRNRWALGGAVAVAAVVVVFSAVWRERYGRLAERRDEESFRTEDGCLVLADGRLPAGALAR
jgi:membrane protein YdbS with pleckstrin-like domain